MIVHMFFKKLWKDFCKVYSPYRMGQISICLFLTLFILDYQNIPSKVVGGISQSMLWVLLVSVFLLGLAELMKLHFFSLWKIHVINPLDFCSAVAMVTSLLYAGARLCVIETTRFVWPWLLLAICSGILICWRAYRYRIGEEKLDKNKAGSDIREDLIDLKDLYQGPVHVNGGQPVLLQEADVDYDLLGRENVIDQLYQSITHCYSQRGYVISLCGDWGSGKTTIIKNTKRILLADSDKYVCIDTFNPWLYGSEEILLRALLDQLLESTGVKYKPALMNKSIKRIVNLIASNAPERKALFDLFSENSTAQETLANLKNRISEYIRLSAKRYVFFIDNLDRTSEENIIFLFKVVNLVLDLPGVVYVLSYEDDRVDAILSQTHEYDKRFTDKIVQQVISVPSPSGERINEVIRRCFKNTILSYNISEDRLKLFDIFVDYIIEKNRDLRTFKRMINTAVLTALSFPELRNIDDLMAIELIRFYNSDLYEAIRTHPVYFIFCNHQTDAFLFGMRLGEMSEKAGEFFTSLFSKTEIGELEKEILKKIFPPVDNYFRDGDSFPESYYSTAIYRESQKGCRICDGKYFDIYFSRSSNRYLEIGNDVDRYIESINGCNNDEERQEKILQKFTMIDLKEDVEWVSQLGLRVTKIAADAQLGFACGILTFMGLSVKHSIFENGELRDRIIPILEDVFLNCSNDVLASALARISGKYKYLYVLGKIYTRWQRKQGVTSDKLDAIQETYFNLCQNVLEKQIDIYKEENYYKGNYWGLYWYCDNQGKKDEFCKLISSLLTPQSIYLFLGDYAGSEENGVIDIPSMLRCLNEPKVVEKLVKENPPKTSDEWHVKSAYDRGNHHEEMEKKHPSIQL